jgi:hypothetical protein
MQDELKKIISQAMNTSSQFEEEPIAQFHEGELSDEDLEAVAGGTVCLPFLRTLPCKFNTLIKTLGFFCPRL